MKKTYVLLMLCCVLAACKKNSVDFTFSPTAPRAGEKVSFTNQSSSGEEWSWTFGDGTVSTLKSPTHTYKQAGTYLVALKVDDKSSWTATHQITVYDTIPSFGCKDSVFSIFNDYTFEALVYNPYNYDVSYQWYLPEETAYAVVTDSCYTKNTLHLYFTRAMDAAPIALQVILNGDTTLALKMFQVDNRTTRSLLFRTQDGDYRQRVFGQRAEEAREDATATDILEAELDTIQLYNDSIFVLSALKSTFPGIQGFHIANRKIYYRADGLWVANIDGAYKVQIDAADCPAMTLDTKDNRIYWANAQGIWHMLFVGSDNNKFVTVPQPLNTFTGVTKMAIDTELK